MNALFIRPGFLRDVLPAYVFKRVADREFDLPARALFWGYQTPDFFQRWVEIQGQRPRELGINHPWVHGVHVNPVSVAAEVAQAPVEFVGEV